MTAGFGQVLFLVLSYRHELCFPISSSSSQRARAILLGEDKVDAVQIGHGPGSIHLIELTRCRITCWREPTCGSIRLRSRLAASVLGQSLAVKQHQIDRPPIADPPQPT